MSCPYCLSFTPPAAVPRPVRSGLIGPGAALQQRQIEQSRTLVKAQKESSLKLLLSSSLPGILGV